MTGPIGWYNTRGFDGQMVGQLLARILFGSKIVYAEENLRGDC